MSYVKFKVLEVCDTRKEGSQVEVGAVLRGQINNDNTKVFFTDRANCEWIFYIGDTCELVNE